jgi:hypothetical protein
VRDYFDIIFSCHITVLIRLTRYIVTFTAYEDDYKHRDDSGVYPETPQIFRTMEGAMKYIDEEIKERLEDELCDYDIPKHVKHCFDTSDCNLMSIKPEYQNHNSLMKLYNAMAVGEFIPYKFDWKISKSKVRK